MIFSTPYINNIPACSVCPSLATDCARASEMNSSCIKECKSMYQFGEGRR